MKKLTQAEAKYGRGNPIDHCGICVYYQGAHRCSRVMGNVSPYGLSNQYKAQINPFGKTMSPGEKIAVKNMAADARDRSAMYQDALQ
jgi:hypothetical protein